MDITDIITDIKASLDWRTGRICLGLDDRRTLVRRKADKIRILA
jgi:hypothetical protein